jgi:dTDP-4-amino-4,6-dideoxygalactose transaminase
VYTGAKPVFVDSAAFQLHNPGQARIEEHISPVHLAEAIEHRIKLGRKPAALILAHLYGRMDPNVAELVQRWDIPLVEDAAEGFGATLNGRPAGSFGAASALSFNGNKLLTTSGGGALLTDDETLYKRARYFASQAREPAVHYEHSNIGYNYRLSNLLAALGLSQLKRINAKMEARKRINDAYRQRLGTLPGVYFPEPEAGVTPSNWLTVLYIDAERSGTTRDAILSALRASGVEARPTWKPMHLQPVYAQAAFYGNRTQGPAAQQFATGLCLPSGGGLSVTDLDRICRVVEHCFKGQLVQP